MILRIEDIKGTCEKILTAVDSSEVSTLTTTLQIKAIGNFLNLCVTNREYFVQVKTELDEPIEFNATVNANLFLKLISKITTESITLDVNESSLVIKGNGTYKLPLIFDDEKLLELPEININNKTNTFTVSSNILNSILLYNSKELNKAVVSSPVQKLYYIDNKGAITFTSGACVNNFSLEQPISILLNAKIVKLFKLFKDEPVSFTIGYDSISDDIIQTKVRFESRCVVITAIISCDDTMLKSVPVSAIRNRADMEYPYSVNLNRDELSQTINRLLLFADSSESYVKPYSCFEFEKDYVTIYDTNKDNHEIIYYNNEKSNIETKYTAVLDLMDLKTTLENCTEQYLTINFGNEEAIVISRGNIKNIIPEIIM